MLPSMPTLFPRESQSGDGFFFVPAPGPSRHVELPVKLPPTPVAPMQNVAEVEAKKKEDWKNDEQVETEEDLQEILFVTTYFNKVRSKLGAQKFTQFKEILNKFKEGRDSPVDLHRSLEAVFGEHQELCEEFLMFLTPGQATEVGRFMDHLMLAKIFKFIQYLLSTFARKPAKLRKVIRAVTSALSGAPEELRARVEPHIRTSQRLLQYFRALFPEERPPDSLYTEEQTEEFPESAWAEDGSSHRIVLEETAAAARDAVGKNSLDVTYLQGQVFLQRGRMLRPARVTFAGSSLPAHAHVHRLAPTPAPHRLAPAPAPHPAASAPAHDSDDDRSPRRKNLKSPKRTHSKSPCSRNILKTQKNKSPERATKNSSEPTKKCIRIVVDAQIEAKSAAAETKRLPELSVNIPIMTRMIHNDKSSESSESPSHILLGSHNTSANSKDAVRSKRKRELSPDADVKAYDLKKRSRAKHSRRLEVRKTEELHQKAEENGKNHVKVKPESEKCDKSKSARAKDTKSDTHKRIENKHSKTEEAKSNAEAKAFTETDFIKPSPKTKETKPEGQRRLDWTREEDKAILQVLKHETESEETFTKMRELLPHRTMEELQDRFFHVMELLRQMALGEVT